jgi:hypothetical protein
MGRAASCLFQWLALCTYLTTPFLLAMDGVRVEETESCKEARGCGA